MKIPLRVDLDRSRVSNLDHGVTHNGQHVLWVLVNVQKLCERLPTEGDATNAWQWASYGNASVD